jgi:hypothetical protein
MSTSTFELNRSPAAFIAMLEVDSWAPRVLLLAPIYSSILASGL